MNSKKNFFSKYKSQQFIHKFNPENKSYKKTITIYFGSSPYDSPKRMRHMITELSSSFNKTIYIDPPTGSINQRINNIIFTTIFLFKIKSKNYLIISSRLNTFFYFLLSELIFRNIEKKIFMVYEDRSIQCGKKILKHFIKFDEIISDKLATISGCPSTHFIKYSQHRKVIYPWVDLGNRHFINQKQLSSKPIILIWKPFRDMDNYELYSEIIKSEKVREKFDFVIRGPILVRNKSFYKFKNLCKEYNLDAIFRNTQFEEINWHSIELGLELTINYRHFHTVEVPNKTRHYSLTKTPLLTNNKHLLEIGPIVKLKDKKIIEKLINYKSLDINKKCEEYNRKFNNTNIKKILFS